MPSCAIVTCKHRSDLINFHTDGITFHRFPSDPKIKEKWIAATCRGPIWWPLKRSTICSIHFTENQFRPMPKSRRLFDWAVPTLKLPQRPTTSSPKHEITPETNDIPIEAIRKPSDANQPILPEEIDSNKKIVSGTVNSPAKIDLDKETESARLDETQRKHEMRIQLHSFKAAIQQKNMKIRSLQKQTSRYRKKIAETKDVMKELQEKKLVNSDQVAHLENLGVTDILERYEKQQSTSQNITVKQSPTEEEPEIKQEVGDHFSEHEDDIEEKLENRKRQHEANPADIAKRIKTENPDLEEFSMESALQKNVQIEEPEVPSSDIPQQQLNRKISKILKPKAVAVDCPPPKLEVLTVDINKDSDPFPMDFMRSVLSSQNEILTVLKSQVLLQEPDPDLLTFLRLIGAKLSRFHYIKRKEMQNTIIDFINKNDSK